MGWVAGRWSRRWNGDEPSVGAARTARLTPVCMTTAFPLTVSRSRCRKRDWLALNVQWARTGRGRAESGAARPVAVQRIMHRLNDVVQEAITRRAPCQWRCPNSPPSPPCWDCCPPSRSSLPAVTKMRRMNDKRRRKDSAARGGGGRGRGKTTLLEMLCKAMANATTSSRSPTTSTQRISACSERGRLAREHHGRGNGRLPAHGDPRSASINRSVDDWWRSSRTGLRVHRVLRRTIWQRSDRTVGSDHLRVRRRRRRKIPRQRRPGITARTAGDQQDVSNPTSAELVVMEADARKMRGAAPLCEWAASVGRAREVMPSSVRQGC